MFTPQDLFDLSAFAHSRLFSGRVFAWAALERLEVYLAECLSNSIGPAGTPVTVHPDAVIEGQVILGAGTVVEAGAYIRGPAVFGAACQIRHGAYVRGTVLAGDRCVIGHATEVTRSILLDQAQAPHFAYIGDSILGNRVNLGAGTRLANWPLQPSPPLGGDPPTVRLRYGERVIDTGFAKLGAILGDDVQLGCNVVTNPGCVVGPRTAVYALSLLMPTYYASDSIIKLRQSQEVVQRESRHSTG